MEVFIPSVSCSRTVGFCTPIAGAGCLTHSSSTTLLGAPRAGCHSLPATSSIVQTPGLALKRRSVVLPSRTLVGGRGLVGIAGNGSRWSAGTWLDSSAQVETQVPLQEAWALWEDREGVNRWMPWITSVEVLKDKPELSKWTLQYEGLGQKVEFSWLARNMQPIHHQKIHWRSVDGLPNSGAVRFFPRGPSACAVQLTISYEVPEQLAGLISALSPLVESILKADLERFAEFARDNRVRAVQGK